MRRLLILLLVTCGALSAADGRLRVVTTTTILADIVRQVGGDRVVVTSLLRPGGDAHAFQPTPADLAQVAAAAVVVENGLGLEGWLADLVGASGFRGRRIIASDGISPLTGGAADHDHGDHDHGAVDPHAWQDLANGIRYARNIGDGLAAADAAGAADYTAWCEAYCGLLRVLDAWVRRQVATIPTGARVLVTSHAALAYYGRAYGLEIHAVEGLTTGQEPDPRHLAALIALVRSRRLGAVFVENVANPAAVERLAREAGTTHGGRLVSDGLDQPDQPTGTYIGMFLVNTRTIVRGLAPSAP